jgi:hypothetical protein
MNTQVRGYTEFYQGSIDPVEMEEILHRGIGDGPVRPVGPVRLTHRPGWAVAVAAAVVTVVVLGGVAWLAQLGGDAPPAQEPTVVTTLPEQVTVPEPETLTDTTVSATTATIEVAEAVPPPGEGPKLEFVRVERPNNQRLVHVSTSSVWYQGALYVVAWDDGWVLYRTDDGITWELLPGFPGDIDHLKTDGVHLVTAASALPPAGSGNCAGSDAFFEVSTSTNGVDWTSSKIPLPVPEEANVAGCFQADVGEMAAGPRGIIVTGGLSLVVGAGFGSNLYDPDDGIHVETTVDLDRGVIIAEFFIEPDMEPTGEIVEISLDDAGFSELFSYMEAEPGWEPLIEPLLQSISIGPEGFVSRDFAWYSPDGTTWQSLDASGPLQATGETTGETGISDIVATQDGFIAAAHGRLWESTNGTTWTEGALLPATPWWLHGKPLDVLAGTPISVSSRGVWTIEDAPQELIPGTAMDMTDMDTRFQVGDFGLVGIATAPLRRILFSEDGTTWNLWKPTEIDPEAGYLTIVGIADDFIVLEQDRYLEDVEDAVLWVGTLP